MSTTFLSSPFPRGASSLLVGSSLLLIGLGCVMIYSTTAPLTLGDFVPPHLARHGLGVFLGLLAALFFAYLPSRAFRILGPVLFVLAILALCAVPLIGIKVNGAQRWLPLPGLGVFQPGELAKFATVLAVAVLATQHGEKQRMSRHHVLFSLAAGALPAGLLILQPDFGNAALLGILVGALLFAAGAPLRWLLLPGGVGAGLAALFVVIHPYAWRRLVGFLDPWGNIETQGFQLVQSFVAFARGGPFGVGLGYGRQKLHYLPEAHTDFVLSVIAEELGLLGVFLVLLGFALVLGAGVRIALRCEDRFSSLLAFGMTLLVVVPALVNAAVVMGAVPTKGLSLPFLSYGRSSLVMSCAAMGVVWGVSRKARGQGRKKPQAPVPKNARRAKSGLLRKRRRPSKPLDPT